jgi:hypothetical protein
MKDRFDVGRALSIASCNDDCGIGFSKSTKNNSSLVTKAGLLRGMNII